MFGYISYKQFMHMYLMVHTFKLEKLEDKKELLCLFAVEKEELVGFKLGYTHPDGVFYSWLGASTKRCEVKELQVS